MEKKIYLVEDNFEIRELIEYLLTGDQFEVAAFGTAKAFKQEMEVSLPDLIILDVMLPDGNGLDICREIKSQFQSSHIPVLLMSANPGNRSKSGESAAEDFISKPFDIEDFLSRVTRLTN
jgi:DNA-binding response OmpR family regulator